MLSKSCLTWLKSPRKSNTAKYNAHMITFLSRNNNKKSKLTAKCFTKNILFLFLKGDSWSLKCCLSLRYFQCLVLVYWDTFHYGDCTGCFFFFFFWNFEKLFRLKYLKITFSKTFLSRACLAKLFSWKIWVFSTIFVLYCFF